MKIFYYPGSDTKSRDLILKILKGFHQEQMFPISPSELELPLMNHFRDFFGCF